MSNTHSEDVSKHIKLYLTIGAALLVGTIVTVWASTFTLGVVLGIALAVLIATVKGSLVAGFFMHLRDEAKLIYVVLAMTAAFIVVMVVILLCAYGDQQGEQHGPFVLEARHAQAHHEHAEEPAESAHPKE